MCCFVCTVAGAEVVIHSESSSSTDGGVPMHVVTDKGKGVMVESTPAVRQPVGVRIGDHAALTHELGDAVPLITDLFTDDEDDFGKKWCHYYFIYVFVLFTEIIFECCKHKCWFVTCGVDPLIN